MLNSRVFEEPSVQEIYPGRLLHVRAVHKPSYLSVDVLGLYQHVNRTHLSSELNRSYRNQIWEAIDQALNSFPARNPLLLGGDFNAQLTAQRPHVGTTCCQPGEGQARGNAKRAAPNYTFPVKAWSVAGHWPVEAEVPVAPFHRRAQQQPSCPNLRFDKIALLQAVQINNDQAQALQSTVHQELAKIESTELHQVRNSINRALLDAVEKHFPQPKPDDNRLSAQGGFRASAKHTWQLYKEMKAAHTVTAHSVFRQWQAIVSFMKASKALRAQSRHLKKASVLHKLAEAETAASKGDQRVLYQIVRSLTPHKHQFLSRLRDSQGRLLDKTASLQAMLQYARDTFSVHADDPAELSMTAGLAITDQAVQQELQKLGAAKAVPFNTAPASVWKYCAGSIAGLLGPALRQHFQDLPQYAYAKSRGTFDAILRVHMHFEANLTALLQQQEMQAVMVQPSNEDTPPDSATGVMTDPSQGLNPEADIFAFCSPTLLQSKQTRTQPLRKEQEAEVEPSEANGSTQPPKRPRPEPNLLMASRQSATSNPRRQPRTPKGQSLSAEARLMARLMLYHEDQLAAQRMDKDFVLFMRQDYASIIPSLHAISVEWHAKKEEGVENLTSSLRTLLLACLVKELLARVQKMASTQEGQEKLQRTKWMDLDQQWTFLRWCHKTKKLVVDDNKPSLSHTELVRQLTFLLENLRGDVIHKFHSTKGLDLVEENASNLPSVTFLLGISLRGERAHEMHEVLCKLLGCSAWQLIGVSLKREGLQRAPAAKQLAKMLYGKSFLGTWQGRSLDDDAALQRTEENSSSLCIGLGALPKHNPNVQSLLDHWYAQE
ncbi:unnamed protein product, partial [Symbiodinium sp. KB8]